MAMATTTTSIIKKKRTVIKFYCCNVGRSVCGTCSQLTDVCTQNQQKASYRPSDAKRSAQGKQLRGHMSRTHAKRERASVGVCVCASALQIFFPRFSLALAARRALAGVRGRARRTRCVRSCSVWFYLPFLLSLFDRRFNAV